MASKASPGKKSARKKPRSSRTSKSVSRDAQKASRRSPASAPPAKPITLVNFALTGGVASKLPETMRERSTLLMEVSIQLRGPRRAEIKLDVISRRVALRNITSGKEDWVVGSTGAAAIIRANDGVVVASTAARSIAAETKLTEARKTSFTATVKPSIKNKTGDSERELSVGAASATSAHNSGTETSYPTEERPLVASQQLDRVEWLYTTPRSLTGTIAYMFGNLVLSATFDWVDSRIRGTVSAWPTDIQLFYRGRQVDRLHEISALFRIRNRVTCGKTGWTADFVEVK